MDIARSTQAASDGAVATGIAATLAGMDTLHHRQRPLITSYSVQIRKVRTNIWQASLGWKTRQSARSGIMTNGPEPDVDVRQVGYPQRLCPVEHLIQSAHRREPGAIEGHCALGHAAAVCVCAGSELHHIG